MSVKAAFAALNRHGAKMRSASLRKLFAEDSGRFARFSAAGAGLNLDYSKNLVTVETMALLEKLAEAADVAGRRKAMFAGEAINTTEGRAVLHTALRADGASRARVAGKSVDPLITAERERFLAFAEDVRSGRYASASGKPASGDRTSARPWRRWRWPPIMTARAFTSSPMSTARIWPMC
jgi:glucose-6-phosphate isomerase